MENNVMEQILKSIRAALELDARKSRYQSDADEKDPRYRAYGVRKPRVDEIIHQHKPDIQALPVDERIRLADQLIRSRMGEEQTIAFYILSKSSGYFDDKHNLAKIESWMKCLFGWSKIDGFTGWLQQRLLGKHEAEIIGLARKWNSSSSSWERRASVVLFTRKVAQSGKFFDEALALCRNLKWDEAEYVQKGVGWCLKDNLRANKKAVVDLIKAWRTAGVSSVITLYAIKDIKDKAERAEILSAKSHEIK
jgi:3-methyladenine DNA glycosylase AlkD